MAFLSQTFSSETLLHGLGLAGAVQLDIQSDPSPEEMLAELQRLEDSQVVSAIIFYSCWVLLWYGCSKKIQGDTKMNYYWDKATCYTSSICAGFFPSTGL